MRQVPQARVQISSSMGSVVDAQRPVPAGQCIAAEDVDVEILGEHRPLVHEGDVHVAERVLQHAALAAAAQVGELAAGLEKLGARTVLVAGKPGDHETVWRASGVTGFIHMGCDQYRLLVDLLQEEGVLHV